MNDICIFDFNGYSSPGHFPVAMWADWNPTTGHVVFGGDWENVPDMVSKNEPTENAVITWAENHLR